jgi:hypothetical protein
MGNERHQMASFISLAHILYVENICGFVKSLNHFHFGQMLLLKRRFF